MSYSPHIYGAARAVTEKTLQLSTRPAAWEHYVASGNVSTQKLYGSEDALRDAYAAAAAAAGNRDIVTLTAQTDGSAALSTPVRDATLSNNPRVSSISPAMLPTRAIVMDMAMFNADLINFGRLYFTGTVSTSNFRWFCTDVELTDSTDLLDLGVGQGAEYLPIPTHPGGILSRQKYLILAADSASIPTTWGELLLNSPVFQVGCYPATAEAAHAIGAELSGGGAVGVPRLFVGTGGGPSSGTDDLINTWSLPLNAPFAGTLTRLDTGWRDATGAGRVAGQLVTFNAGVATDISIPVSAGASRLVVELPGSGFATPLGNRPSAADADLQPDVAYAGYENHWIPLAAPNSIVLHLVGEETPVPNYTGTITITSYVPEEDSALTPEGEPRPTTAVTMTTASSSEQRTINPQDDWSELRKMAWEAARSGQYQFQYFYEWRDVWAYLQEGDLVIPEEKTVSVDILSATYTWYSQSADATEPPPGVTPLYDHKGPGSAEPLTGYADQWYRHTLTYTNA